MDTNRLKRFACEARNILIGGVKQRLTALGFQSDGTVDEKPELMDGGSVFMGEVQTEDFYHKWMSLYNRLQTHSFREVVEEAAYTWFNRLVAIRIMVKNELVPAVLEYESDDVRIPIIVSEARQGRMPQMDDVSYQKLEKLLLNDALTDEQFALLIVAYCHSNPIIQKCFGNISDYTELLLPSNILKSEGFIDRLNADEYITTEDYRSPELIGWLYQFYISERKDEVFAKKGKFEADEIPAATQIFTPNWIVKYMVQNTIGRIYLDNNPYSEIKEGMEYLVEPTEPTPVDSIYQLDDICDLKVADLACGSGHILNECFDLLYQIYIEEGYNRRQAVENIFRHNLTGIDIDTRAKQLTTFALLMKACQKDKSFVDGHCMPKVLDMPLSISEICDCEADGNIQMKLRSILSCYIQGDNHEVLNELTDAIMLMNDAQTLGSIMKFTLSERTRNIIAVRTEEYTKQEFLSSSIKQLIPYMHVILALTTSYSALVMNPPYMGSGNMNSVLSNYVKKYYPDSKTDLMTVFMEVSIRLLKKNGYWAMINWSSWMFLSSFENLRKNLLNSQHISNLLHLGRGIFGSDFGSVAFVMQNKESSTKGYYRRLFKEHVQVRSVETIRQLFLDKNNGSYIVNQKIFEKIPGYPIGYWVNEKLLFAYSHNLLRDNAIFKRGIGTGDNNRFLRWWFEVGVSKSVLLLPKSKAKWFKYNKGGNFRRWYGNRDFFVNWLNDGEEIRNNYSSEGKLSSRPQNLNYNFAKNISYSSLTSGNLSFRIYEDFINDQAGNFFIVKDNENYEMLLALLNTKVATYFKQIKNTTINITADDLLSIPVIKLESNIKSIICQNISISKQDWDAHETSWDFELNPLLSIDENLDEEYLNYEIENHSPKTGEQMYVESVVLQLELLEERLKQFKIKWERMFYQLHANEEELNRLFIDIYGLQDELTPEVPLDEVTILQQGEISIENDQIVWHDDIIIKQFISYAVGCLMGRYSIDCPGLILANQGDGVKEYKTLVPDRRIEIDDDGIIPLMSINNELTDNITLRFKAWLSKTLGEDSLMENVNYVERALGKRLEDYFLKDFWKDHKKMYQNRPIYWLFSSKKGAFQCIAYMHRMNAYTAEKVRTQYLLPHIEWLVTRQAEMQANAANLSTRERKEMDAIGKQIEECREYHDRLHVVADKQIAFDLDDGVVVNYAKFGDVLVKLK